MSSAAAEDLRALIEAAARLQPRLAALADRLHGGAAASAAHRAILQGLVEFGPLTVPAIARLRGTSRQAVQPLVDQLAAEGLVRLVDNPRHRRSRLVEITPAGADLVEALLGREEPALADIARRLDAGEVAVARSLLARLRLLIDAHPEADTR